MTFTATASSVNVFERLCSFSVVGDVRNDFIYRQDLFISATDKVANGVRAIKKKSCFGGTEIEKDIPLLVFAINFMIIVLK